MESRKNLKPLRPQKKRRKERKGLNTTKQWSTPYRRVQSGMCSRSWGIFAGLVVLLFCFSVTTARGQQISQPQKLPAGMNPSPSSLPHRFWDRTNTLLFAGVGVFRGLDYASTRNMQARGREGGVSRAVLLDASHGAPQAGAVGFHRAHWGNRFRGCQELCAEDTPGKCALAR